MNGFPPMPEDALARELGCEVDWWVHTRKWLVSPDVRRFSELASDYHWAHTALWWKQQHRTAAQLDESRKPALAQRVEATYTAITEMRDRALGLAQNLKDRLITAELLVPLPIVVLPQKRSSDG